MMGTRVLPRDSETARQAKAQRRKVVWYAWAKMVVADLDAFKPWGMPSRPADIPEDDNALWLALQTYRSKGVRASTAIADVAEAFGHWRGMVERSEERSKGSLETLVRALQVLDRINDPAVETDRCNVAEFIREHYGLDLPAPCPALTRDELHKLLWRHTRRNDILPSWLLYGWRPPNFIPPEQGEDDDDDA